jgi:hypothetical protein
MDCKHLSRVGDNYGESCADCHKQLSGYGYGGWFGYNLTEPRPVCIHLFAPMGDGGPMICIYCEEMKDEQS